ncbi:hypothetical protein [Candidatus Marithrix sp. Canyon 246]|uniref:hypothetical protein n=1 Tax=Candidatus Marithrix sp. Canyon 246 TaxID=1827136 RepID=UPI00114CCC82|nr:hypothetical protein [Candidatus Marithrix sp. Canyon 246]
MLDIEEISVDTDIKYFAQNHDHYLYGTVAPSSPLTSTSTAIGFYHVFNMKYRISYMSLLHAYIFVIYSFSFN